METTTVAFRVPSTVWTRYSAEAQARGMTMGKYLRARLEERDQLALEVATLRRVVERTALAASPHTETPPLATGALTEAVLLLRFLAGPQKAGIVQKEVERRGLEAVD